jgi:hypothetical protein
MSRVTRPTLVRAFRRAALPLGWYYVVTLAIPLANGASQSGSAFAGHALVVLAVPPLLITLAYAVGTCVRRGDGYDAPRGRQDLRTSSRKVASTPAGRRAMP